MPDVELFLSELAVAVQKHAMYPVGHPALRTVSADLAARLQEVLAEDQELAIGVAKDRLIVAGMPTDRNRALLQTLARRLHDHQIAALHFQRGAGTAELDGVVRELAVDADRRGVPIGLEPAGQLPAWPHIRIEPAEYDALRFEAEEARDERPAVPDASTATAPTPDEDVRRAAAALADLELRPELLALLEQPPDVERPLDGQLQQILEQIAPDELRQLLESREAALATRLVRQSAERLTPRAVVKLIEAASGSASRPIGSWLPRLLTKLAHYAETGAPQDRRESDAALRRVVQDLVDDWELEDPRPSSYSGALGMMSEETADSDRGDARPFIADRVLMMGLELEVVGRMVALALQNLRRENLAELLDLLEAAGTESMVAEVMWRQVATADALAGVLRAEDPVFDTVDRLLGRIGIGAAEPLLDALQQTADPVIQGELAARLCRLGPVVTGAIIARLEAEQPTAAAQLLAILNELQVRLPGFAGGRFFADPDGEVRLGAYRLAIRSGRDRERAILASLAESDPRLLAVGLAAAEEAPPQAAEPLLRRHAMNDGLPIRLRVLAVRALSRCRTETALTTLTKGVTQRRWLFQRRIASPSPFVIEALSCIRDQYRHIPRGREILEQAGRSEHPSIRLAAGMPAGTLAP
ncbi:MAG: hypothetical protein JSV95_13535 [Gemmatimonadota bacterium]|nr:MAG: hypothetical protein JSV95_13535 [Gemmatimonadota bacterium]